MPHTTLSNAQKSFQFYYHTKSNSVLDQRYSIAFNGLLHIPMALSMIHIGKTQGRWHIFLCVLYTLSSISYNISFMLTGHRLYLHSKTWKKLSYISGICVWDLCIIYLMDIAQYPTMRALLEYSQFALVLIWQEPTPQCYKWNWYPIIGNLILFVIIQLYSIIFRHAFPRFNYKNLAISMAFFAAGYLALWQVKPLYTYNAKQDVEDHLRIYHCLCDFCIGVAFHWFWKILPVTDHPQVKKQ